MSKPFAKKLPDTFYIQNDGSLVCEHRDISCCIDCRGKYANIVHVYGQTYWAEDHDELAELLFELETQENS